jgi:hypothetical protein
LLTPSRKLRNRLVTYAFALGYLVVLVIGIVLVAQDHSLTARQVASAVGLNLVASVVFALIFSLLTVQVQERTMQENIEERFTELSANVVATISHNTRTYLPTANYRASDEFDPIFNRDVMRSFATSGNYSFRGPSPRYLPARIKTVRQAPQHIRVIMLDPRLEKAVARRAADRRARPSSQGKTLDDLIAELNDELLMSIVALFDCRRICPVDIIYSGETGVTRTELFDDAVYLTWYHTEASAGRTFPESVRFPVGSLVYETTKLEVGRQYEINELAAQFRSSNRDEDLVAHLRTLTRGASGPEEVFRLRQRYDEFSTPFVRFLEGLP